MSFARRLRFLILACFCLLICAPLWATPLVTGNGFGFGVVSPETGALTKFYAHPFSFSRPDPKDPLSEGLETSNFIKSLTWRCGQRQFPAEYLDDSQIIRATGAGQEVTYFMPFGLKHNVLIISAAANLTSSQPAHWEVEWSHPLKSKKPLANGQLLTFEGIDEPLLLIPITTKTYQAFKQDSDLSSSAAWALISLDTSQDAKRAAADFAKWRAGLSPEVLTQRELAEVERWRVKPAVHFQNDKERHLWRQSESILRMGQSREPNRWGRYSNGLMVACLPDGAFSMPWVRDMAYAAVAFARMGHRDEARAALLAYFNARPTGKMKNEVGGVDYQISVVRYFGDGSEEPFFTNEGSTNIEYDDWGLALWVLGEYIQRYNDPALLKAHTYRGTLYESAIDFVVKPLLANLEEHESGLIVAADTSIWEERQKDKKHFAFSTALAIVGLRNFAEIAHRAGDDRTRGKLQEKIALLEKGFTAAFVRGGTLRGTLEEGIKNDIDGALLSVINYGVVTDPALMNATVDRMELLKVVSGGYRRVRSTYTDPAIYEYWYEREEFLFVDFSLAEILRRQSKHQEAQAILTRIVDKAAADHNFIPEMYVALDCKLFHGAIGDPTGAIPMVGYGAGTFIIDLLQRENPKQMLDLTASAAHN